MTTKRFRVAAAIVAIAYLAIRRFQEYVFHSIGEAREPRGEPRVRRASAPHRRASTAMLAAMFGLIFLYAAVCLQRLRERPVLAGFMFLSFLLFRLSRDRPAVRRADLDAARAASRVRARTRIPRSSIGSPRSSPCSTRCTCRSGSRCWSGTCSGAWLFATDRRIDRVIQAVFVLTVLRNATRLLTVYAGWPLFPSGAYTARTSRWSSCTTCDRLLVPQAR